MGLLNKQGACARPLEPGRRVEITQVWVCPWRLVVLRLLRPGTSALLLKGACAPCASALAIWGMKPNQGKSRFFQCGFRNAPTRGRGRLECGIAEGGS